MAVGRRVCFVLFIVVFFTYDVHCQSAACDGVTCPEQLECRYPKTEVVLPDPLNKECCNITECICDGTNFGLSTIFYKSQSKCNALLRLYTNCTMVDGNLEIVAIQTSNAEDYRIVNATKHIKSVTGYVLIAHNHVDYIDLSSLRLIRGMTLFNEDMAKQVCGRPIQENKNKKQYALYISGNQVDASEGNGLKEIYMPNLTEIMRGHVKIQENRDLCYIDSIIWRGEIFNTEDQSVKILQTGGPACGQCPLSCVNDEVDGEPHCWGGGEEMCQKFTRIPCKDKCLRRCSQPLPKRRTNRRCCERYCASGCTTSGECLACADYNNFGTCERRCPTGVNRRDFFVGLNSEAVRYEFSVFCVRECPSTRKTLESERKCVFTCPFDHYEEDGSCKPCPYGGCSNICYGLGAKIGPLKYDNVIHSGNIGNFSKNCTIIEGSLSFRRSSFDGDIYCQIDPISNASIYEVFKNVEVITGILNIGYWPYKDLCIFSNLKQIRGKMLLTLYSLVISTYDNDLRNLCFNSLEEIETGSIEIVSNSQLCYADQVNWDLFIQPEEKKNISRNKQPSLCAPCSDQCDFANACWGPTSNQCVSCKYFTDYTDPSGNFATKWVTDLVSQKSLPGHNVTNCVEMCDFKKGVYATDDGKCFPCHDQCRTCDGPGPTNCSTSFPSTHECSAVLFVNSCVAECPVSHYADAGNVCQPCSPGCIGGCKGPANGYANDGCSTCHSQYDATAGLTIYEGPSCSVCVSNFKDVECTGCTYNIITREYKCRNETSAAPYILIPVMRVIVVSLMVVVIITQI